MKPQRGCGLRVGFRASVFPDGDAEAARVVPHRPAYAVPLKRRANVLNPAQARVRGGEGSIDSELVAGERHAALLRPVGGERDHALDPLRVPALFAVSLWSTARRLVLDRWQKGGDRVGA